ncbi:G-box-binding factor-like [Anopheles bellator]|uniref:G-box-binding factor-like n=1 Tax=Anopheles bellator TaxID=139047 RepID=UPI0026495C97|nr:G-box-binding factor-like [Anopheles bellator]
MSRQAPMPGPTAAPVPSTVAYGGVSLLDKLDRLVSSTVLQEARVYPVTVPGATRLPAGNDGPTAVTPSTVLTTVVQTDDFVVHPGPEDVLLLNTTTGLYQQSVTLTARMYPIEATAAKSIWGLPTLIWAVLIGTVVILLLILATLFFCCWLQPRTRKLLNSSYYTTTTSAGNASQSSIVTKSCTGSSDSNQLVMPLSIGICPPQYSAPPPPQQSQQQQQQQGSQSHHGSSGAAGGSNSSLHHASHGPSAHHTCNATAVGNQQCSMASGGQDYGHVKYGSSPQQHYSQQHQQQYAHHHHAQHHQHQCIHYQQQQQQQQHQQQYNQQLHQQQHAQQHHHVHGQQQYPYNQHQYYHHPAQQQQQQQQYLHYQQHQQQHHPPQLQQRDHHHQHHSQQQQHQQQQQQQQHRQSSSGHHHSPQSQLAHSQLHKSMWAINPLYASSGVMNDDHEGDTSTSYRTRSLPSWGKNRQRPLSNADDLEELYAKVNFSKKRRNRMRNDEAAIIALCRSRSQNLAALPLATDQDAVVVYDERTAL